MTNPADIQLTLGADSTQLKRTLAEVQKEIKSTFDQIKKSTSITDLSNLNQKYKELLDYQKALKGVGIAESFKKSSNSFAQSSSQINNSAKQSRIALTNLSLVAQDLPFGFIGIQNNLPGVVQSFGNLITKSKGVIGVFKELGKALIGPAGIFLGFSIVTSAITLAVQKYGSLGAAIDAIFGKTNALRKVIEDATKSQEDFNDSFKTNGQIIAEATGSTQAQITKVRLLSDTVSDLTKSEELRKNALSELQKIDKTYFGQISTGIQDVGKLEEATRKYTEALLANAVAKGFEQKFTEAAINLQNQKDLLKDLEFQYKDILAAQKKFAEELEGTFDPLTGARITAPGSKEQKAVNDQKAIVEEATKQQNLLKQSFIDATKEALKFVEPITQGTGAVKDYKYEIADLKNMFSFKTQIDDAKELADTILDVNKKYTDRVGALNKLNQLSDGTFNAINLEKTSYNDIKDVIDTYIQKLQILDIELQGRIKSSKLQAQADKNAADALNERIKTEEDLFNQITERTMANDLIANPAAIIGKQNLDAALQPLKDFQEGAKKAAILIEDTFFKPLNDMFTELFTKGTFSFKKFTQSILQSIGQIAAKLIATGIVQSLISIFAIPFGGSLASGGALGFLGDVINPSRRRSNVDFSNVRNGSSMEMEGQVNLVLRGADLVGSINRTNAQILRTG